MTSRAGIRRRWKPAALSAVRTLERLCPLPVLIGLLWPVAAVRAVRELRHRGRMPDAFAPNATPARAAWALWRDRVHSQLAKLMILWPDRLAEPRWRRRCDLSAAGRLGELAGRRPVVLVTLHFGPLALLKYCLRLVGLPVAVLVGRDNAMRPGYRRRLDALSDRVTGLATTPHLFDLTQVRAAIHFVDGGGMLLMAIDGVHGRKTVVRGERYALRLATGPVRVAIRTGALIVPCLVVPGRWFRIRIMVGDPIECGTVEETCSAVLHAFLPVITTSPAHWERRLVRAFYGVE